MTPVYKLSASLGQTLPFTVAGLVTAAGACSPSTSFSVLVTEAVLTVVVLSLAVLSLVVLSLQ
jgi:hypothetical protein